MSTAKKLTSAEKTKIAHRVIGTWLAKEESIESFAARLAKIDARAAHTRNFHSRRGTWEPTNIHPVVSLYDNNPHGGSFKRGTCPQREADFAELRAVVEQLGGRELARAYYPTRGGSKGYTINVVYTGVEEKTVLAKFDEILGRRYTVKPAPPPRRPALRLVKPEAN